jgi:hypothetical protein
MTFVLRVFYKRDLVTTGNGWSQNRLLMSCIKMDFFRVVTKQTLDVFFPRKRNVPFLCYHCKRVLTKKTLDIRNSVPSSLLTQKKLVLTKKGHLIFVISNVFVLLVNHLLVLLTFGTRVFFLRKKNGPLETGGHKTDS